MWTLLSIMLSQLNKLLKDKIMLYQNLKTLLQEEENVIVQGNVTNLQKFLLKKELLLKKLRNLEEKRKIVLIEIARGMGLSFKDLSLSNIIKKTNDPISSELSESRRQLTSLLQNISKLHSHNNKLLSKSSKSNKRILSFFDSYIKNYSYAPSVEIENYSHKSWILNTDA